MPTNRLIEKEEIATYASVLLEGALASGGESAALEIRDEAEKIVAIMRSNIELTKSIDDSALSAEQRNMIARNTFAQCNPVLVDVLSVMAERNQFKLLSRVWNSYDELLSSKLDVTVVDVATVVELDDHLRDLIINKAKAEFGTEIVLRERVDSSILGGILISANGKRIDASVLTQLEYARGVLKDSVDGGEC